MKVVPNSNEDKIKANDKGITVYVREMAKNNQANHSVERLFSKITHRPTKIVSGFKQKRKRLKIDISEQELYKRIKEVQ